MLEARVSQKLAGPKNTLSKTGMSPDDDEPQVAGDVTFTFDQLMNDRDNRQVDESEILEVSRLSNSIFIDASQDESRLSLGNSTEKYQRLSPDKKRYSDVKQRQSPAKRQASGKEKRPSPAKVDKPLRTFEEADADYGSDDSGGVNFDKLETLLEARASKYTTTTPIKAEDSLRRTKEEVKKVEDETIPIKELEEARIKAE